SVLMFPQFDIGIVSAAILRWWMHYASFFGIAFFRLNNGRFSPINPKLRVFFLFSRLLILCGFLYFYWAFLMMVTLPVQQKLHYVRRAVLSLSFLWLTGLQVVRGPQIISTGNKVLKLFRKIRSMAYQPKSGIGGRWEFVIILLSVACHLEELVFVVFLKKYVSPLILLESFCHMSIAMCTHLTQYIGLFFYIAVGNLYAELNAQVKHHLSILQDPLLRPTWRSRGLKECLSLYRKIRDTVTTFQAVWEVHQCVIVLQKMMFMLVVSYRMIVNLKFDDYAMWFSLWKVLILFLLICLSVQRAMDELKVTKNLAEELYLQLESKYWHQKMELFLIELRLYDMKVRVLGLFEVSNRTIPAFMAAFASYIIYIFQCVLKFRNE
ncbi:hypothetical protein KR018_002754, partial [Drosophila ironensis]